MRLSNIVLPVIIVAIIAFFSSMGILADWWWFSELGFDPVYFIMITWRVALFLVGFAVFFAIIYANVRIAARAAASVSGGAGARVRPPLPIVVVAALFSFFAGLSLSAVWETVLAFLNATPFSVTEPVFGNDVGFYVFTLPVYDLIVNSLLTALIIGGLLAAATYATGIFGISIRSQDGRPPTIVIEREDGGLDWQYYLRRFLPQANAILFLVFVVLAAKIWLARYGVLFSSGGVVFGAGYTDVNVTLPVYTILTAVALVIGIGFLVNEKFSNVKVITYGVGAFVVIAIAGAIVGAAVQGLVVEPNEQNLEGPYLAHNIEATLAAYGLDTAEEREFPVAYDLTAEDIAVNDATIKNIRVWDWRPLKTTYEQLQLFRTYYYFNDVDVDRYQIDGAYKEVLVSAREMQIKNLPSQAQTWVNTHLVYTHGYGVVMNPVDEVTSEGLPVFYIKDIPPQSSYLEITRPELYYGEETGDYVITDTSTDEFDYPAGDRNIYTDYAGTGGVPLDSGLKRFVYATRFGSVELLVSGSLGESSRILINRNVAERAATIAPFLSYDSDPYIVIDEGRQYWVIDAYTTTDQYPYSRPVWVWALDGAYLNYIRNSVKVVVDAYNGDVSYYVVDQNDPLIKTYDKIFPGLFKDFSEMPPGIAEHIRYPEGIFSVQAELYATYHMKDPQVFYNQEDAWVVPDEIYRGGRQQMEPYFVIMKLPGEDSGEEFILMLPFVPRNKENLIAWMAARCDPPNYGKIIVYQFSKQELTYGPMQIEARIDQDTEISQDITLWSQSGSSVLRGNTLVIPIKNSIIYVEPLYLEATERGTLPQLQRVIVAYNDRLTMQKTLDESLAVIFGGTVTPEGPVTPPTAEEAVTIGRVLEYYLKAEAALAQGDLGKYQEYVDAIGKLVGA